MVKFILATALLTLSLNAMADGDHTPDVCTSSSPAICAHLGHFSPINSTSEVQFVAHIETPDNEQVRNIAVDLWMPTMGHGSSPVSLTQLGVNKYRVQNAFFIMSGQWVVRVKFTMAGVNYTLSIPVMVAQ